MNFEEMLANLFVAPVAKPERYARTEEGYLIIIGNNSPMVNKLLCAVQQMDVNHPAFQAACKSVGVPVQNQAILVTDEFWDTTPQGLRDAVIAHEVGHLIGNHLYSEAAIGAVGLMCVDSFELEADAYAAKKCGAKVMRDALRHTVDQIAQTQTKKMAEEKGAKANGFAHKLTVFLIKVAMFAHPQMRARIRALKALQKAGY